MNKFKESLKVDKENINVKDLQEKYKNQNGKTQEKEWRKRKDERIREIHSIKG